MMKISIIALFALGCAYAAYVPEMENENPPGIVEIPPEAERFVEGDMIMTGYEEMEMQQGIQTTSVSNIWPKNKATGLVTLPYVNTIRDSYFEGKLKEAFADYAKYTCIRFKRTSSTTRDAHISFYKGGGCSSAVGWRSGRKNSISLARGCWRKGTILHEIAHSLGIYHTQSRKDRDSHVEIIWANIPKDKQHNFRSYNHLNNHGTSYDYNSMMHYGGTAFGGGKITIRTLNKHYQDKIGQRAGFSQGDITQINRMYNCNVSTKPSGCSSKKDLKSSCSYWKGKGFCAKGNKYYNFMMTNCAKTCCE